MSVVVALLVLAWIALALLALALAGVIRQLRDLQAAVHQAHGAPIARAPQTVVPTGSAALAIILLADPSCPVCEDLGASLRELITAAPDDLDFVLLCPRPSPTWLAEVERGRLRLVTESQSFHRMDPGYRPALLLVDRDAKILASEPIGSVRGLRSVVEAYAARRLQTTKSASTTQ